MRGRQYVYNGVLAVCPNPTPNYDCKVVDQGGFLVDGAYRKMDGSVLLHVSFDNGLKGYADYNDRFSPLAAFYAEEEKQKRMRAERERCMRGVPRIGMADGEAKRTLCEPDHRNTTITGNHVREQWVYPGMYLYFDNGRLSSIQFTR
jgi:hypothetical protein